MFARRAVLGALLGAASAPAWAQSDSGPPLPPHLDTLRALALTRPDGAPTTLGEALAPGAASVVSFWATWCGPCVAEARHLARTRSRIGAEQLDIVGVNVDRRRDEARIADFLQRGAVNYTQLRGDPAAYQAFGGGDQILLPRLFVFYPDGRPLRAFGRYVQMVTLGQVDRAIRQAIAGAA